MRRRAFRPVLVSIGSCLVGLGVGVVAQIIHRRNYEREVGRVTEEFESGGWSPPLLVDRLKPSLLPIVFMVIFGLMGILAYLSYYWFVSRKSDET